MVVDLVRVMGRDSQDFLNRILTCAVKSLGESGAEQGRWMPGCLLGGDGRIRHEVVVVKQGEEDFLVVGLSPVGLHETGAVGLYESLDMYLFTESVELKALGAGQLSYGGAVGAGLGVGDWRRVGGDGGECLQLRGDMGVSGDGLVLIWGGETSGEEGATWPVRLPLFGRDYGRGNLPLESGLKAAVSFTKGCFPGQEIMARIENLGHPAKLLVGWKGSAAVGDRLMGQKGDGTEVEVGVVTSSDGSGGLAMVKWDWREAGTVLDRGAAEPGQITILGPVEKYFGA